MKVVLPGILKLPPLNFLWIGAVACSCTLFTASPSFSASSTSNQGADQASDDEGKSDEAPSSKPKKDIPPPPTPTLADVPYGPHPKQTLDFWKAKSDTPTPLVFYIHGGGWNHGSKISVEGPDYGTVEAYLAAGISVTSINYRYASEAEEEGIKPPVQGPLGDAARALQFVRSKAAEWNIDKQKIAAAGGSAGGCTSLWLAFHDDMADPKSDDPVARESTRLLCAAVAVPQTSIDPKQMKEWIPNSTYGAQAYGFKADHKRHLSSFDVMLEHRDEILPWINEYSPYALLTADDPPIFMIFRNTPAIGKDQSNPTHTANFGLKLQERCAELGVPCVFINRGTPENERSTIKDFLMEKLKPTAQVAKKP